MPRVTITFDLKPGARAFQFIESTQKSKQMCPHKAECWNEGRAHNTLFKHPPKGKCKFEVLGSCKKHDDEDHMHKWLHLLKKGKKDDEETWN